MQIVVCDSSVIIDLAKVHLVEPAFKLPHQFIISDVMFSDELLDLGSYERDDLLTAGISTASLDGNGVGLAFHYAGKYSALTDYDCFALALAKVTDSSLLLTGDGGLRKAADAENVTVKGILWLCDEMNDHKAVEHTRLHDALVCLSNDPFVRVPKAEINKRIQYLATKGK